MGASSRLHFEWTKWLEEEETQERRGLRMMSKKSSLHGPRVSLRDVKCNIICVNM